MEKLKAFQAIELFVACNVNHKGKKGGKKKKMKKK